MVHSLYYYYYYLYYRNHCVQARAPARTCVSESRVQLYNTSNVYMQLSNRETCIIRIPFAARCVHRYAIYFPYAPHLSTAPPQNTRCTHAFLHLSRLYPARRRRLTASAGNLVSALNSFCLHFFFLIPVPWASVWPTFVRARFRAATYMTRSAGSRI